MTTNGAKRLERDVVRPQRDARWLERDTKNYKATWNGNREWSSFSLLHLYLGEVWDFFISFHIRKVEVVYLAFIIKIEQFLTYRNLGLTLDPIWDIVPRET